MSELQFPQAIIFNNYHLEMEGVNEGLVFSCHLAWVRGKFVKACIVHDGRDFKVFVRDKDEWRELKDYDVWSIDLDLEMAIDFALKVSCEVYGKPSDGIDLKHIAYVANRKRPFYKVRLEPLDVGKLERFIKKHTSTCIKAWVYPDIVILQFSENLCWYHGDDNECLGPYMHYIIFIDFMNEIVIRLEEEVEP